jgi:hypothetical protein
LRLRERRKKGLLPRCTKFARSIRAASIHSSNLDIIYEKIKENRF